MLSSDAFRHRAVLRCVCVCVWLQGNSTIDKINLWTIEYNQGVDAYLQGNWGQARTILTKCSHSQVNRSPPDERPHRESPAPTAFRTLLSLLCAA